MTKKVNIDQNMMLAATRHGLSACPTAALSHSAIKRLPGIDRLTDAPVYALTLSIPELDPHSAGRPIN
ncbi:nitroreductase family protein [Mesorhizobium sp. CO1-1-11]|uniref:nitroreductase family protein n=1 Tax=Mesorhizobium sp. CO1-1-11 TaxID=2876636 RepID=UPI001CCBC219|nr:nitroreductase family protein [Mesorhizobium sp. CO1-1-11]MBZ9726181.1 nitroreductase family protein [Mesorhizobium sp. CO1-1-11]